MSDIRYPFQTEKEEFPDLRTDPSYESSVMNFSFYLVRKKVNMIVQHYCIIIQNEYKLHKKSLMILREKLSQNRVALRGTNFPSFR